MGELLDIVTPLHKRTKRDYIGRMTDHKVECMKTARKYGPEFWDGDRRFGYGGYRYDGRWKPVAEKMIQRYALGPGASVLDVGCGKGYLLYELSALLPGARLAGFDISDYAVDQAKPEVRDMLFVHRAEHEFPFEDDSFDLVISLTTLHNLEPFDLEQSLGEIERVGRAGYVLVESFRSDAELFNLQCWALTCRTFLSPAGWEWLFAKSGYAGDFEFIYFE